MGPRVWVVGARPVKREGRWLWPLIKELDPEVVITGGATGTDNSVKYWCGREGVPCVGFFSPSTRYRRFGGRVRNGWIVRILKPDLLITMPGGRFVKEAEELAESRGIRVIPCPYSEMTPRRLWDAAGQDHESR